MPIIRDILYGAAQRGANLQAMCRAMNISASDLNRSDLSLDFRQAYTAWQIAVEATGDRNLGLLLGRSTTPSILGIVGHLMQNCRTLREAFEQVCEYSAVATDMFRYSIATRGKHTLLVFSPAAAWTRVSPLTARQAIDQAMSGCLNVFFLLSGRHVQPTAAEFSYARPSQPDRHTQTFGATLRFGARTNALVFGHEDLQLPLPQHDRSLFATFESLVKKQLKTRRGRTSFASEVMHCMRFEFAAQVPSLEVMAARMNMSARTFQRRLSEEDRNYRDMADLAAKDIALALLSSGNMKISDLSQLMGYSEPRAFRRAFKRWTKETPRKQKQKQAR